MHRSRSGSHFMTLWRGRNSAAAASPPGRFVPGRGDVEKVLQHEMPMLGRNALGMELHAMNRQPPMRKAHDQAVFGFGRDGEIIRQGRALDDQGMIAGGLERGIDAP